jgi:KaiC/GvpD/RAD55 family RecA-like ATPase
VPSSGVPALDGIIGGKGYPDRSAILITGPPGIGKEALGYWFTQSGLQEGDFCVYLTRLSLHEIIEDQKAFGIPAPAQSPLWIAREGGQVKLDLNNLPKLAEEIRSLLVENANRKIRIVMDILSSILMLNPAETVYRFVDGLIIDVKQHDAVLVATLEDGMHSAQTIVAMQQLFDGVIESSFQKTGLKIRSLLRIAKMRGTSPRQEYHRFAFARSGLQVETIEESIGSREIASSSPPSGDKPVGPVQTQGLTGVQAQTVFDYLVRSFKEDYLDRKFAIEQAGWRTRQAISDNTQVAIGSFYGKDGKLGSLLKELLSSGLVEARFFAGQRGRGGEVTKLRVAYEKEHVKRIVNASDSDRGESL